jgi:hypothetical protein
MPSFKVAVIAALAAVASALPSSQRLTARQLRYHEIAKRQNAAATALGLSDPDILQFALTLEHLESAFYQQGFAKFPDSDFQALGLTEQQIKDLKQIGDTEAQHVGLLQSAIAQAQFKPVEACTYNFGFTDAAGMVATALALENVGVSAYLGAAPLLADPAILGTAGSILTIEGRHQSVLRVFAKQEAIPVAFDVPLGPRAVFSLAAPFIQECPSGSNLAIQAFPALAMDGAAVGVTAVGTALKVKADGSASATNCAFTSGGVFPGGTKFSTFTEGEGCEVPKGVAGITYLTLTTSAPLDGVITDDLVVAGPMIVTVS